MRLKSGVYWLFHLFSFLLLLSCAEEKFVGSLSDYPGEKEGLIKTFYENGQLYEEGQFTSNKYQGFRKIYYPSGELQVHETYDNNQYNGPYRKYYENGQTKVDGEYINGVMQGIWKTYYEAGGIKDEVTMHDNLENGPFTEYHSNGKTSAIGTYINGEFEQGLLQLFNESGTLVKKMECDKGICRTIWKKEEAI